MEIRFCDRCTESIPDSDFDSGRAVTVDGKNFHVTCALTRSLALSGSRSWLTFLLALYAAGAVTFLLVVGLRSNEEPNTVNPAVAAHVERAIDDVETQSEAKRAAIAYGAEQDVGQLTAAFTTLKRQLEDRLESFSRDISKAGGATEAHIDGLQGRMGNLEADLRKLNNLIRDVMRLVEEEAAARRAAPPPAQPVQPTPVAPTVDPVEPAIEEPDPEPPVNSLKHQAEVTKWIERLDNSNESVRFSATLQLGQLKDLRAAPKLIEVLAKDRDYYVRVGAATALGDMRSVNSVPHLIEALDDKDTLVRTAADDSLRAITKHKVHFLREMSAGERKKVMKEWREWWGENEPSLRDRYNQPAGG